MADGAEELEAGEKTWINHQLYTNVFTKHFAVLLSQLCERSLATGVNIFRGQGALRKNYMVRSMMRAIAALPDYTIYTLTPFSSRHVVSQWALACGCLGELR